MVLDGIDDLAYLNDLLKPATNALDKGALGTVGEHTAGLDFIDNVKLVEQAFSKISDLGKLLRVDDELSSEICTNELKTMAEGFPRIVFDSTLHVDEIHLNSILKVKNLGIISDLQSLLGKRLLIATAKPTLSVSASLNLLPSLPNGPMPLP